MIHLDCFGTEVATEEIARWNRLLCEEEPYRNRWNDGMPPFSPDHVEHDEEAARFVPSWVPMSTDLPFDSVVEVGCGVGDKARSMMSMCRSYVGIDLSTFAIAHCRWKFQHRPNCRFLHTVYDRDEILAIRDVDAYLGINFFYHQPIERIGPMLDHMAPRLSDGGWILVDLLRHEDFDTTSPGRVLGEKWWCWTHDEIDFGAHGLEVSRVVETDFPDDPRTRKNVVLTRVQEA